MSKHSYEPSHSRWARILALILAALLGTGTLAMIVTLFTEL